MRLHKYIKIILIVVALAAGSAVAVTISLDSPTRFPVDI
ncbi:MAG: hypothetical protein ACI9NY_001001 [Kiritimatiellia bacterium]|jgi:hypothetical protein